MTGAPWAGKKSWEEADIERLRELVAAGQSASKIGMLLGRTKNSVISRARTSRIQFKRAASNRARAHAVRSAKRAAKRPKPKAPRRTKPAVPNPWGWGNIQAVKPAAKLPQLPRSEARVSILDAGYRQCRYVGERPETITAETPVFCGNPTDGGSWCPAHRVRVMRPPLQR